MNEIVEEGGNGFLARPADAAALADCLGKLLGDAGLRRRCGQRSRALYEQKFALPAVVANTARYYQQVAVSHAGGETTPETTQDVLARVLAVVTGLGREAAGRAAQALLDPSGQAVDYVAALRRLMRQPDAEFVTALYRLLLGREPDEVGWTNFLRDLGTGTPRADVIRGIALSAESQRRGTPTAWLDRLGPTAKTPFARRALRLVRRLLGRVRPQDVWQVEFAALSSTQERGVSRLSQSDHSGDAREMRSAA
jgi:hypothetical protein